MRLYNALVVPVLLYGSETWTMKAEDERRLAACEMTCIRVILGVSKLQKKRNTKLREKAKLTQTILEKITYKRLTWFWHVNRMKEKRIAKISMQGRVDGKISRGRPWQESPGRSV